MRARTYGQATIKAVHSVSVGINRNIPPPVLRLNTFFDDDILQVSPTTSFPILPRLHLGLAYQMLLLVCPQRLATGTQWLAQEPSFTCVEE